MTSSGSLWKHITAVSVLSEGHFDCPVAAVHQLQILQHADPRTSQ